MSGSVSPLPWTGNKGCIYTTIDAFMPPHRTYVEACMGSAEVFLRKKPVEKEIINDYNGDLVRFFRVLQRNENLERLIGRLFLSFNSEQIFRANKALLAEVPNMASRGAINSMLQISPEIEEAAVIVGVPWWKRLIRILIPIQKTSIMSGYLLPFVAAMREVDLFALLVANSNYLLTTMLLAFNQTGYEQYASAITLLIIVIVLIVNGLSSKLTGASIAKGVDSGAPIGGR